jgi:hypothetical protein
VGKNYWLKNDFVVLNMLANLDWSRPVYFSTTLSGAAYLNLKPYMQLEGLAYRLMPIYNAGAADGVVNTPVMYENMMKKMFWRNLDNPDVYYDENYKRFPLNSRKSFYMLASQLLIESQMENDTAMGQVSVNPEGGKSKRQLAKEVLAYCFKVMPDKGTPFDVYTPQFLPLLLELGERKQADEIAETMNRRASEELAYQVKNLNSVNNFDIQTNLFILRQIYMSYKGAGLNDLANKYKQSYDAYQGYDQSGMDEGAMYEEE